MIRGMHLLNITEEVRVDDEIFLCGDANTDVGERKQSKGEGHVLHVEVGSTAGNFKPLNSVEPGRLFSIEDSVHDATRVVFANHAEQKHGTSPASEKDSPSF